MVVVVVVVVVVVGSSGARNREIASSFLLHLHAPFVICVSRHLDALNAKRLTVTDVTDVLEMEIPSRID